LLKAGAAPAFSFVRDDCLATLSELILRHQTLDQHGNKKIILNTFLSLKNPFAIRATGAPGWVFTPLPVSRCCRLPSAILFWGKLAVLPGEVKAPAAARRSTSITVFLKKRRRARSDH
jgi:hypothetical protein